MAISDYSIVGTVLALAVAILLLSGLALYVAFRIRETLRDEKGGSTRAVKVAFLIGLLFLSGGVFYFFASGFNLPGVSSSSPGTSSVSTSSSTSTPTSSTVTITSSSSSPAGTSGSSSVSTSSSATSTITSTTSTGGGSVIMQLTYPSSVSVSQVFNVQFSIYNSGSTALSGASLDVGNLAVTFTIVNATVCTPSCTGASWSGSVVTIGNLNPGATVVTLGVKAPSSPTQFSSQVTLYYQGESQPISLPITIRVSGRP